MDIQKTGILISELRRKNHMTQKELAEKLHVTDKAVSKWERGAGYPEITTVPLLAETLGVTANEILTGCLADADKEQRKDEPAEQKSADVNLSQTVEYIEELGREKTMRRNNLVLFVMTAAFLTAVFVCCLCNYIIDGRFSWSLYVVGSVVTAWLTAAPILKLRRNRAVASMAGLTVSVVPLLMLIESLCPAKNWVFPFALPITVITMASLWAAVLLFPCFKGKRLFYLALLLFLFGVVDDLVIHFFVNRWMSLPGTPEQNLPDFIVAASCGFAAVILFCFAASRRKKAGAKDNRNR